MLLNKLNSYAYKTNNKIVFTFSSYNDYYQSMVIKHEKRVNAIKYRCISKLCDLKKYSSSESRFYSRLFCNVSTFKAHEVLSGFTCEVAKSSVAN